MSTKVASSGDPCVKTELVSSFVKNITTTKIDKWYETRTYFYVVFTSPCAAGSESIIEYMCVKLRVGRSGGESLDFLPTRLSRAADAALHTNNLEITDLSNNDYSIPRYLRATFLMFGFV